MAIFEKTEFSKDTINLDDNIYRNCKFIECLMVYSGGPYPELVSNDFIDCQWKFVGAANRTINFMRGLYHAGAKEMIEATMDVMRTPPEMKGKTENDKR